MKKTTFTTSVRRYLIISEESNFKDSKSSSFSAFFLSPLSYQKRHLVVQRSNNNDDDVSPEFVVLFSGLVIVATIFPPYCISFLPTPGEQQHCCYYYYYKKTITNYTNKKNTSETESTFL